MNNELWLVKIGSNSLIDKDGQLNHAAIENIAGQIAELCQLGVKVVFVSSGAVAAGRQILGELMSISEINKQQMLAAAGQPLLMQTYSEAFSKLNHQVAQVLLTKNDFQEDITANNLLSCIESLLANQIIPIVNENDVTSVRELMFTDNDELTCLLALQLGADKMVLITAVDGLYTEHPDSPGSELIREVLSYQDIFKVVSDQKSSHGRGGMLSKLKSCQKLTQVGTDCYITSLSESDCLSKIQAGESVGTHFLPQQKAVKARKRNILKKFNRAKAKVVVNECLADLLRKNSQVLSILPVGIERIIGDFNSDDLVEVADDQGNSLALGVAAYSSAELSNYLGLANQPYLIHYDYLFCYG